VLGASAGRLTARYEQPCDKRKRQRWTSRLAIRYRGLDLPYTTFDKLRQVSQGAIIENKHLGAALALIREQQRQTRSSETRKRRAVSGR
jgi:hypothetical protein